MQFRATRPNRRLRAAPKIFDAVFGAIVHALLWFKPTGSRHDQLFFYSSEIERLIDEIRAADPSLPLAKGATRQHALAVLKDQLGTLVHRPHPYGDLIKKEPIPAGARNPNKKKQR